MELSTQDLLQAIKEEYHKVFQEIKDGTLTEIPTGENKTKQVFFMKNGNWGLSSGKLRKDGRKGDTTTVYRLEKIAKVYLAKMTSKIIKETFIKKLAAIIPMQNT